MFGRHKRAARPQIDEKALQEALRVLERWHEENPDKFIQGIVHKNGKARFVIQDKEEAELVQ